MMFVTFLEISQVVFYVTKYQCLDIVYYRIDGAYSLNANNFNRFFNKLFLCAARAIKVRFLDSAEYLQLETIVTNRVSVFFNFIHALHP